MIKIYLGIKKFCSGIGVYCDQSSLRAFYGHLNSFKSFSYEIGVHKFIFIALFCLHRVDKMMSILTLVNHVEIFFEIFYQLWVSKLNIFQKAKPDNEAVSSESDRVIPELNKDQQLFDDAISSACQLIKSQSLMKLVTQNVTSLCLQRALPMGISLYELLQKMTNLQVLLVLQCSTVPLKLL